MAKKEFDISNDKELRILRKKWERRDFKKRYIKPYFFGHVEKMKGFYDTSHKNYLKHDSTMDYLREAVKKYQPPLFKGPTLLLSEILRNVGDVDKESRRIINIIMNQIEMFKKNAFFIWNGYANTAERYKIYVEEEKKVIDTINQRAINERTVYRLIKRLEKKDNSDFSLRVLFNMGNQKAFDLVVRSKDPVELLEESPDGDIDLYGITFKKRKN